MDEIGRLNAAAVETIFHAALELSSADREAYLHTACGEDPRLYRRVIALLEAHGAPEGLLPENSSENLGPRLTPPSDQELPGSEKLGDKIGRYKLLQRIGEGGCGVVYMAEQQEPVRRRIALKVIKLGMDTKQVVARFEAERQALALMDHANIAKVLDAGATETGRPFFVMELVRGIKITDYCDQNRLSTAERLDLFVQVCRAIEHAHQKGIIHRDIKPSNVLITRHDGVAVPKVIDFGIAKATQGRLTNQTFFTAFEQFIGTPAYMSPEQAEMSGLDVDTRSDIYSLGVLLYELLTGQPPFDPKELMASGLDAMRQTIREAEPTRPSALLSTMVQGDLATAARCRQVEPLKLISSIRGDLEWIVMKCLDKDRTRRYDTASALAADILRLLKNEPILARSPSPLYVLQKLVRRHRLLVVSTGAIAAALLIGLSLSTWLWLQEREARRRSVAAEKRADDLLVRARTEAGKSQQVSRFLADMLRGVGPAVALGRDTTVLKEILSNSLKNANLSLGNQPDVQAQLLITMGSVYQQLADFDQAENLMGRALNLRIGFFGTNHLEVAQAYSALSGALWEQGKPQDAETAQRRALLIFETSPGDNELEVARSLHQLGQYLAGQGRLGEAEDLFRRALQIRQARLGDDSLDTAESQVDVGESISNSGRWEEAEILYRHALAINRKQLSSDHPTVATLLQSLAQLLVSHDKALEAEVLAREALQIRRKLLAPDHPLIAESLTTLALILESQHKVTEAEDEVRRALALHRKHLNSEHPGLANTLRCFVTLLLPQHREAEVEQMFADLPPMSNLRGKHAAELLEIRANFLARIHRWQEAAAIFRKLVHDYPDYHYYYHSLAPLLVQIDDVEAYTRLREQIQLHFGSITNDASMADRMAKDCLLLPLPGQDRTIESRLADVAVSLGQGSTARSWFEFCKGFAELRQGHFSEAIEWMQKVVPTENSQPDRGVEAYMVLAIANHHLNLNEAARVALAKGLQISKNHPPDFTTSEHGWIDWLIGQALVREAKALIELDQPVSTLPQ